MREAFGAIPTSSEANGFRKYLAARSAGAAVLTQEWAATALMNAAAACNEIAHREQDTVLLLRELLISDSFMSPKSGSVSENLPLLAVRYVLDSLLFSKGPGALPRLFRALQHPASGFTLSEEQRTWVESEYKVLT